MRKPYQNSIDLKNKIIEELKEVGAAKVSILSTRLYRKDASIKNSDVYRMVSVLKKLGVVKEIESKKIKLV